MNVYHNVGDKIGKFTVLSKNERKSGCSYELICECGKQRNLSHYEISVKGRISCGHEKRKDLIGMKFGRLTVLRKSSLKERNNIHRNSWVCLCECGKETIVDTYNLKAELTRSCGCLLVEHLKAMAHPIRRTGDVLSCSKCGIMKPSEEFYTEKKNGRLSKTSRCKECIKNDPERRQKQHEYNKNNPEKRRKREKLWADKNKHIVAWKRVLKNFLNSINKKKTNRTHKLLGYSAQDLKTHLESLWTPGMTWDNYGNKGWHIDHIKSKSLFSPDTPASIVNALTNLKPMWCSSRTINGKWYEGNWNKGVRDDTLKFHEAI